MVAALLALALALAVLAAVLARPSEWRSVAVSNRVLVSLRSGPSISGILVRARGPLLIVAGASLHEEGAPGPVALDGETVIERGNVAFVQVLPAAEPGAEG